MFIVGTSRNIFHEIILKQHIIPPINHCVSRETRTTCTKIQLLWPIISLIFPKVYRFLGKCV